MEKVFKKLLLLALPASGKSEVRKFLASINPEELSRDFHLGPTVQLDDFPYVHMMRRIDDELKALGSQPKFFLSPDKPFLEPVTWGVLIELLNEDYAELLANRKIMPLSCAEHLLKRIDDARIKLHLPSVFFDAGQPLMAPELMQQLKNKLELEAKDLLEKKWAEFPETLEGKTILFEFARGGPDGSAMPIPYGYEYSLGLLSPEILKDAAILYVWVTPEESRRKNFERSDPNDPGSILKHGVPLEVMLHDYGCDDINYLLSVSDKPGYLKIKDFYIPCAKFDNRVDRTSFVRNDTWQETEKQALHQGLKSAFNALFELDAAVTAK